MLRQKSVLLCGSIRAATKITNGWLSTSRAFLRPDWWNNRSRLLINLKIESTVMSVTFPERFNMAHYFLYHNVDKGRENKVCLYFQERSWTYGETVEFSNRTGNALRELGIEMEDRVLIVLPDCPEFVWTWFGAARIGAVITMVNPLLPVSDYKYYLDYTRARVAVIHESLLPAFSEAATASPYLRAVLVVGNEQTLAPETKTKWQRFDDFVATCESECTPADTRRDDIAIWLFTSGS